MSRYLSKIAGSIEPYVPGEQPKNERLIKLNTNENPYPPAPGVIKAINEACGEGGKLRLYPEPTCERLRETIAAYYGLCSNEVFTGNGSDEVLAFAFRAFFDPGSRILFPKLSYSFYPVYCRLFEIEYETVDMTEDYEICTEQLMGRSCGIVIANPNAPTGVCLPASDIERILKSNPDNVVIVDEAYVDFGGESSVALIRKYPNLLVIQTLSKSRALAGLRVGYALGDNQLVKGLELIKNSVNSYTLDTLAMAGAEAAFADEEYFKSRCSAVAATRERCRKGLLEKGFYVTASRANFLFARHPQKSGKLIQDGLRKGGILVRRFDIPGIEDFLRISIGTDEEMNAFMDIISDIV